MKNKRTVGMLLVILLLVISVFIIFITPVFDKYKNIGKLIINEVMPVNKNTISDQFGNYNDYIEIYNGYDYDVNLNGYYLSDDDYETKKWQFPDVTIKSGSYLIVYASGLDIYKEGELHTNFKLDKDNEVVTLSSKDAKALSKIRYFNMIDDTSYGYDGEEYSYYYVGTPGEKNAGQKSKTPIKISNSKQKLYINEYIVENKTVLKSKLGYYSAVELYNAESYDINLSGYFLSDDLNNKTKYKFPNVTIKSNDYLIVYTSGEDLYKDGELHTNFELTKQDKFLVISDSSKNEINKINIKESNVDLSYGIYKDEWKQYSNSTFGSSNGSNYIEKNKVIKDVIINEVSAITPEAIELKNLTNKDINLKNYSISDESGFKSKLPNIILKANSYIVLYGSDKKSYSNGKVYLGFHINNSEETLYLYKDNILIDEFDVGRLVLGVSAGINNNNKKVYYKEITMGKSNSKKQYNGYTMEPRFSIQNIYVEKGSKVTLTANKNAKIYYTLDGTFPSNKSTEYKGPITINNTVVIKAIAYQDGYLQSEIISRTYIVGRHHDLGVVSLSTNDNDLFGKNGIITSYNQDTSRKISFEFYENDGTLGVSFIGDTKLSGMDSRKQPQKSMAIYLRKEYGLQEVTYPFFENNSTITYSSILLRNAGEDPKRIRIMDAVLTRTLKGQMDIDMQDYRPVVVYINGKYFGMYNLREKLNGDYVESKHGVDKDNIDLIKYNTPTKGSMKSYNDLINYVMSHDPKDKKVYEYLKTQIDMQELCNYWVVQSYYGNTDLGNIRFWKEKSNGKWRFMIYDLDWSLWNTNLSVGYPVVNEKIPAATYLYSTINLTRRLYRNSEFKDLYLKTFAYHIKNTFNPTRMNKIVDELQKEIEKEMPYHINKWGYPSSISTWKNNIKNFKKIINNRYNNVLNRLQNDFNLSNKEYDYYFGEVRK